MFNGWTGNNMGIRTIIVNGKEYGTASIGETGKLDVDVDIDVPCKSLSVRFILEWKKQGKVWVEGWRDLPCGCCSEEFEMRKHKYDQEAKTI